MLTRSHLRNVLRLAAWPAAVIVALNIEEWAEAFGFDKLLVQNWNPAISSVLSVLQSNWFQYPAILIVGAAIGLWLDTFLRGREQARYSVPTEIGSDTQVNGPSMETFEPSAQDRVASSSSPQTSKSLKHYSTYEIDRLSAVIAEIFDILHGDGQASVEMGAGLYHAWKQRILEHGPRELENELAGFVKQVNDPLERIQKIVSNHELYLEDLKFLFQRNEYTPGVDTATNEFRRAVLKLPEKVDDSLLELLEPTAEDFYKGVSERARWIRDTKSKLQRMRTDLQGR